MSQDAPQAQSMEGAPEGAAAASLPDPLPVGPSVSSPGYQQGVLQAAGQPTSPGAAPATDYYYPAAMYQYDPYYSNLVYSQPVGGQGAGAAVPMTYGAAQARMALPTEITEEEPVYVNAKQYHCILRRRQQRAKAEAENKLIKTRRPYLHQSRHIHATKRIRGAGGRFLTADEARQLQAEASEEGSGGGTSLSAASSQPGETAQAATSNRRQQGSSAAAGAVDRRASMQQQRSTAHSLCDLEGAQHANGIESPVQPPPDGAPGAPSAPTQQQQHQEGQHHGAPAGFATVTVQ